MTVQVHKYLLNVQSLRTSIQSILFCTSDTCSMRPEYDLILLAVRVTAQRTSRLTEMREGCPEQYHAEGSCVGRDQIVEASLLHQ